MGIKNKKFDLGPSLKPKYGSHIPVLLKVISITNGPVLELGMGPFSTPLLHWICKGRILESYDNNRNYYAWLRRFNTENHKVTFVENWDDADIERSWDVVFIDHGPGERRIEEIKRLANLANYIIIHDTNWQQDHNYHYKEIYPMFKWHYNYKLYSPHTGILSNKIDLTGFKV